MKTKLLLILIANLFLVGCTSDTEEIIDEINLTTSYPFDYTLNTVGGGSTGASFGNTFTSGNIQIATGTPSDYDITFYFSWYRMTPSQYQVLGPLHSLTLKAGETWAEADLSGADFLLQMECELGGRSSEDINATFEVRIHNATSLDPNFDFDEIAIQNNSLGYSVTYNCGWTTDQF